MTVKGAALCGGMLVRAADIDGKRVCLTESTDMRGAAEIQGERGYLTWSTDVLGCRDSR